MSLTEFGDLQKRRKMWFPLEAQRVISTKTVFTKVVGLILLYSFGDDQLFYENQLLGSQNIKGTVQNLVK